MTHFKMLVLSIGLAVTAGHAMAQGAIGNGVPQAKAPKAKPLTAQECADRKASGAAKDARQDRQCARLMKKAMKPAAAASS